jgi:cyclopropane fatty-acyl-phospholipid synthase-like methyltransferase
MKPLDVDLDWHRWFEQWEAMQNCYIPQRLHRFDLMFELADMPRDGAVHILDLGCGPGSLSFRALERYPNARIVAVDFDPVLHTMAQEVAGVRADRIQFVQVDIRQAAWWAEYDGTFDLVVSATALHWLNAEHLDEIYRRVYKALKPGGRFINSDHVASDDPQMQIRFREMKEARQRTAFQESRADDWNTFWDGLARELGQINMQELRDIDEYWEGTEDGQPQQFHIEALQQSGFEQVKIHWQDLGDAVMGARKPVVRA